jgi:lipoprotein-releasing system permease protein
MVSRIIPDEKKEVTPYPEVLAELNGIARVDAFSPFVQTSGVLRKGKSLRQVSLRGIDPVREGTVVNLGRNIVQGSLGELGFTPDGILLGDGLARKLTARYHEVIRLTTESGTVLSMTVVGIFSSGFSAADDNTGYINLARAQAISGRSRNAVSGIGVHSASMDRLPELARQIERATGYRAETWDEANANLLTVFQRNNNITLLLVVFVFIVSGFGIANTLVTTVLQKQRDIAVMKSIGFSVRSIEGIFLIQGAVIGIAGTLTGCIGGYALTEIIGLLPVSYGASAVVRGSSIAVVQTLSSYVITVCFSLAVSVGASVAPARRAARLQPVQILRA